MPAIPPLTASAMVAIGGGAGALLRYHVGRVFDASPNAFPWPTLAINIAGSLAMGLLVGVLARHGDSEAWRLLLGVGLLGGFTTFSAFSLELVTLAQRGAYALAATYALASVAIAALALIAGLALAKASS